MAYLLMKDLNKMFIPNSVSDWLFIVLDLLLVAFIVVNIVDMNRFVVRKQTIVTPKLKKGESVHFVFLTDLHNKKFRNNNEELLGTIKNLAPDFILCGGDIMTAKPGRKNETAVSFMNRLCRDYTVYYALGNHEHRTRLYPESYHTMYEDYFKALENPNLMLLDNESVILEKENLRITGFTVEKEYYKRFKKQTLPEGYVEKKVGKPDPERFHVLMAHNPEYGDDYFKYGADLFLAGHLHGGIIRLPFIGGIASPSIRLFPKYNGGMYEKNSHYGYVSCGLGTHTVPLRFNNPGEITFFTIEGQ